MKKKRQDATPTTFYASPLADDIARDAFDGLADDQSATFYAAFEAPEAEEAPRQINWLRAGFIALVLLFSGAVLFLRALPLLPPEQAEEQMEEQVEEAVEPANDALQAQSEPIAALSPDTVALPADGALPAVSIAAQTAASAARTYTRTALLVDGKNRGVLVSREAAEALLDEIRAYYEAEIRASYDVTGTLESVIDNEITYEDAPDTPEEDLLSSEAMFTRLTAEKPLSVLCTETIVAAESIPCETQTEKDKYLLAGTSIIVSPGQDGQTLTTRTILYKNARQRTESEEDVQVREPINRVVRLGSQKLTTEDSPGKREGKRGPETDLLFQSPLGEDANAKVVSNYGQRNGVLHLGLDYEAETEQPAVLCACAGTVVCVMERGGYGLMVEVDHGGGFVSRYAHLAAAAVRAGDAVLQGQPIGTLGQSGNAERPHLHFELRINGEAYNPRNYLE